MSINWGKLFAEGRCREVGISWTEKEAVELFVKKTATVEEVRARHYPEKIAELQEAIQDVTVEDTVVEDVINTETTTDIEVEVELPKVEVPEVIVKSTGENSKLDNLKQEATDLGIQFAPNIGEKTLQERVNKAKS